ncbi:hypothetical protein GWI33_006130 [Rhynchophorus ferrugineus]|uniref:PEHE domain-containing protein n=1 Tax=Rhynchophorus ferrugineus TaxID=354439 RepID=A0A834II75_RHYFE|nr:hypothetical protein GWI33_006130 [Rhynchophorus ferrugineus]
MGLRTASVRHSDAEVMAPALTDSVQTQNFNISSKSHLEPASPINSFETGKYSPTLAKTCSVPSSPLNTDDLSISLEDLDADNLDSKRHLLEGFLGKVNSASDSTFSQNMSVSSPPMGDREDKMGLQKTGLNISNVNKSKNSNDVDQLFKNALEPNVDEIMQVIKSIENNEQLNNSTDLNDVLDLNIDKDLLDHVDNMMNMSIDENQDDLETAQKIKENQAGLLLADLQKKHARLERRLNVFRRKCYKLESKLVGQHVSGEIAGVFEQVYRSVKKFKDNNDNSKCMGPFSRDFSEKPKPISGNSAKLLVKKLDMASVLQASNAARHKNITKYFGSGSIETSLFKHTASGQANIPPWSREHQQELQKLSEQLHTQLGLIQDELDSEATESSSGGESCDESQVYNNPHQQYLSIQKRALWKYSTDRAAIASRWTWLQSQISDLEYRIRQHTDIHKQIRNEKGSVQLGDGQSGATTETYLGTEGESKIGSTDNVSTVNGYLGQLPGAVGMRTENDKEDCQQCARTRPLVNFKKRRLLQVAGLHAVSKKAARPSTVRCSCVPSQEPCALCTGRIDPTNPRDPPETLGKAEKIALLDPGFHPVLSLPEDCSETLHLEAIMKHHEWQQRSARVKTMKIHKREQTEQKALEHRTKKLEHRKKYARLKSSTVAALSEKIKNKLKRRKVGRPAGIGKFKKRQSQSTITFSQHPNYDLGTEDVDVEATVGSSSGSFAQGRSQFDSPDGSPLLQMQPISSYKQHNRNSRSDSYDIDNIVIPYSVAASTRVEKLQYKEILTPKWRIADIEPLSRSAVKNNGSVSDFGEDSDVEDLSEEAVVARHDRSEIDEKKRFLSYLKLPSGYGRPRSHKRQDSVAETSRANTPDPVSPYPDGAKSSDGTLLSSPPPTPGIGVVVDESLPSNTRKRTVSQSRLKDDLHSADFVEQLPYENRAFPLTDVEYDHMLHEMPDAHREIKTNFRAQDTGEDLPAKDKCVGDSADSETTESAIGDDSILGEEEDALMDEEEDEDEEDPNDPEWTDAEKSGHRDRHRR